MVHNTCLKSGSSRSTLWNGDQCVGISLGSTLASTLWRGETGLGRERMLQWQQNLSLQLGCPFRVDLHSHSLPPSISHCMQALFDWRHVPEYHSAEAHEQPTLPATEKKRSSYLYSPPQHLSTTKHWLQSPSHHSLCAYLFLMLSWPQYRRNSR